MDVSDLPDTLHLSCVAGGCGNAHPPYHFSRHQSKDEEVITRCINKVAFLDKQIELFHVKRAAILNQINMIQSVAYTIPAEVLSYLMEMAVDMVSRDNTSSYLPLTFSAVSSYWRQVAHSTPRIWRSLRLDFINHSEVTTFVNNKIPLLRHYFERAKYLPLSLAFCSCDSEPVAIQPLLDIAVRDNPTRIKSLRGHWETVLHWQNHKTVYPELQNLEISEGGYERFCGWVLPIAPNLRRLVLEHTILSDPTLLSSTNITHLTLCEVPYEDCVYMFLELRKTIVEFRCTVQSNPMFPPRMTVEDYGDTIYTFPRLETLNWDLFNILGAPEFPECHSWDIFILWNLNLPSLHNVTITNLFHHHVASETPRSLITPSHLSMMHISTACLSDPGFQKDEFIKFLDHVNTSILSLDVCDEQVIHALHALTPSYHPEKKVLIPGLVELWITRMTLAPMGYYYPSGIKRWGSFVYVILTRMIEERLSSAQTGTTFYLAFCKPEPEDFDEYNDRLQCLTENKPLKLSRCGDIPGKDGMERFLVTLKNPA